jgi:mannan endo-1,4-beta-mannosidase
MTSRLVTLLAVAVAAAAVILTGFRLVSAPSRPPAAHAPLPRRPASYLGVYEPGAPPAWAPVSGFTAAAGAQPNLVGYFSGWAEPFQASYARTLHQHGVIPFVQIDPTFASVDGIADGDYDSYLRAYADSVRDFGHAVVIGFGHEMNAPWYSWGYGHTPPATFVAAWKHIVNLFRRQGADNVTWLWTINADERGTGPIQDWWPGDSYVTWVGIDGFYYRPSDTFGRVFGPTIRQVHAMTGKPVLLSETAVGPDAGQFAKIGDLFTGMRQDKALGLVWFDIRQHDGVDHQDWRIEGSQVAEAAFRLGISALNLVRG